MYSPPTIADMFGDVSAKDGKALAERFNVYKSTLAECHARTRGGEYAFLPGEGMVKAPGAETRSGLAALADLEKSLTADQITAVQSSLDAAKSALQADITKDWTNSNPLSTGLVPYDLAPVLQLLVPRHLAIRNRINRIRGMGSAKEFRQITGVTGSQTGGVANATTFFASDSASTAFGPVSLRRPGKISYASNKVTVPYMEQGVSDQVNIRAQYTGLGYTDLRSLSHTASLWAHLLGEEKNFLFGRGTASGFQGAVATPGAFTAAAGGTGGTIPAATYSVKLTSFTGQGESLPTSPVSTGAVTLGQKVTLTLNTSEPAGLIAYGVYMAVGAGNETFQGFFVPSGGASAPVIVLGSFTAGSANFPASDGSASANAFDGLLTMQATPSQSGYLSRLNATLSTANPGVEFQTAFQALYVGSGPSAQARLADPECILTTAAVRVELSDAIKNNGSGNGGGYRLQITQDEIGGIALGSVVTQITNEVTGRVVDVLVHPYMPVGAAVIWSETLPIPDSGVSRTVEFAVVDGADTLVLEWPVIQMTYDLSTYTLGSLLHYAPGWSGAILGIN